MATKISINIDLSQSNRTHSHDDLAPKNKSLTAPVEYKYRYDRIFLFAVITLIIIAVSLYLLFTEEENVDQKTSKSIPAHEIIKERHLTVPPSIPQKPRKHLVSLYYEEINPFETFQFPLKKPTPIPEKPHLAKEIAEPSKPLSDEKIKIEDLQEIEVELKIKVPAPTILNPPQPSKGVNDSTEEPDFIQIYSNDLSRVLLVSNIYKKEPLNKLSYIVTGQEDSAKKTYLFTQIDNRMGQSIEHQWWYKDKMRYQRKFTILGQRWRCYSSKNLGKLQQGKWLIKVVDENGDTLSTVNFKYQTAP
ncbi:DUF2914 domain-containing protein [sulfur-oxidizing endosymbiont of Gigantopelta aegis]|uniref:DUF2914 domain-containing protein n=1 Tax=sulfur-oxidizing endosymbiont of Gigantopelta aegis TaxID=2794934 RepID=UPI0018DD0370|nr:DUF2914 domain-containing protein [sulfur-oxidizing endosymbiont of Gigantopelta aegis]